MQLKVKKLELATVAAKPTDTTENKAYIICSSVPQNRAGQIFFHFEKIATSMNWPAEDLGRH